MNHDLYIEQREFYNLNRTENLKKLNQDKELTLLLSILHNEDFQLRLQEKYNHSDLGKNFCDKSERTVALTFVILMTNRYLRSFKIFSSATPNNLDWQSDLIVHSSTKQTQLLIQVSYECHFLSWWEFLILGKRFHLHCVLSHLSPRQHLTSWKHIRQIVFL